MIKLVGLIVFLHCTLQSCSYNETSNVACIDERIRYHYNRDIYREFNHEIIDDYVVASLVDDTSVCFVMNVDENACKVVVLHFQLSDDSLVQLMESLHKCAFERRFDITDVYQKDSCHFLVRNDLHGMLMPDTVICVDYR